MDYFREERLRYKISNDLLTISAPAITKTKQNKTKDEESNILLQFGSEKKEISVNKELLKDRVPYFNGMFSNCFQESSQSVINLGVTVDSNSASKLIQLISKGSLKVSGDYIQGVCVLADLWGMEGVKNVCTYFMISQMDSSNSLELLQLGEMHSCDKLIVNCRRLIGQEFQIVCQTEAFLKISSDFLISVLEAIGLNTGIQGEGCVLNAVIKWYHQDTVNRETALVDVLKHIDVLGISEEAFEFIIPDLPTTVVNGIQSRIDSKCVTNTQQYKQRFMVFCGYSQSRTGPTCPRTNSAELFDPKTGKFQRISFPEAPSYGVALNLFGRIIFIATYVHAAEKTVSGKKSHSSKVFTFRPCVEGNEWLLTAELFSAQATECISDCLTREGCVVHCPEKNCIYAIEINKSVCIEVTCTDGTILCDYKNDLPSLLPHLDSSHLGLQGVCYKGRLFTLGGYYGPQLEQMFSDDVLALSEDGLQWESRQAMLIPRFGFAVTSYGDKLIVSGGYGGRGHRRRHQSCESYDPVEDKWEHFGLLQQSRSGHCMVVANDFLYVIGGKSYASQKMTCEGGWHPGGARIVSDFVEVYGQSSKQWLRIARMHNARCNFYTVVM